MYYSLIGIITILTIFVVNFNTIFAKKENVNNRRAHNLYRVFLLVLVIFCLTDILWGVLADHKLLIAMSIDTDMYFIAMTLSVFIWTRFELAYLEEDNKTFEIVLKIVGWLVLGVGVVLVVVNFITPVLFYIDENGAYIPLPTRYGFLIFQIVLYILTSIYALLVALNNQGEAKTKHLTVSAFGVVMASAILLQIFFPDYPMYAAGILLGDCLLYTFAVRLETDAYKREIKERKVREAEQQEELGSAKELAYTDPLTGVKNKHAYVEKESEVDLLIRDGKMEKFAIIVFDLNDLKLVNDTYGHDVGDRYIVSACQLIAKHFKGEDIYRFGGDEFVVILQGESFSTRNRLLEKFNDQIEKNIGSSDEPIVATGLSDFNPHKDNTLRAVFIRADEKMYIRKRSLKEMDHVGQWN